ncbi:hypothetical protein J7K25_05945 [bacterium]|nr:hypothetical protein [bacterium]
MGKLDREMKKIHRKKREKARELLKMLESGKITYNDLNRVAKKLFYKRLKAGYEFPAKIFSPEKKSSGGVA